MTNAAGDLAAACPTVNLALAPFWPSPFLAAFRETFTFLLVIVPAFPIEGRAESSALGIALGEGRIGRKSSFGGTGEGREGSVSGMLLRSAETGEDKRSDSRHPPWGVPTPPSKFQAGLVPFQAVLFQTGTWNPSLSEDSGLATLGVNELEVRIPKSA